MLSTSRVLPQLSAPTINRPGSFTHLCAFSTDSDSGLPRPDSSLTRFGRFRRHLLKSILIAELPIAYFYYRSKAGIVRERRRHVESGYMYIIHPFSKFRSHWESIMTVVIIISMILIPLNPSFYYFKDVNQTVVNEHAIYFVVAYTVLNGLNFVDMILWSSTGIIDVKVKEVSFKPSKIIGSYFKSVHFTFDLIASLPLPLIVYLFPNTLGYGEYLLDLLPLTRLSRLGTVQRYMSRCGDYLQFDHNKRRFRIYLLLTAVCCHWVTCLNIIFPVLIFPKGWSTNILQMMSTNHLVTYLNSLYHSMSYLLCIAQVNGLDTDIEAKVSSAGDIALAISVMIVGFIMCNLIFIHVVQIILSMKSSETKYQAILNQLSNYMSHKQLPINMQKRLMMYYEYRFEKSYFRESAIYASLSETLCTEINIHRCRTLVENVSLLKDIPYDMIGEVLSYLTQEVYLPNDVIVRAGSVGDCMYFIARGTVTVSTPNGREVCHLQDGTYFGEVSLVTREQKRIANVVAIEICELFRLDRKGFISCFATNRVLYKHIERMAQRRMKKCNLLEELHKKFMIERTLRRNIDTEDRDAREREENEEKDLLNNP